MSESKFTGEYEVTADGRVFSMSSNWRGYGVREMRPTLNADGYPSVRLVLDGRRNGGDVQLLRDAIDKLHELTAWASAYDAAKREMMKEEGPHHA